MRGRSPSHYQPLPAMDEASPTTMLSRRGSSNYAHSNSSFELSNDSSPIVRSDYPFPDALQFDRHRTPQFEQYTTPIKFSPTCVVPRNTPSYTQQMPRLVADDNRGYAHHSYSAFKPYIKSEHSLIENHYSDNLLAHTRDDLSRPSTQGHPTELQTPSWSDIIADGYDTNVNAGHGHKPLDPFYRSWTHIQHSAVDE